MVVVEAFKIYCQQLSDIQYSSIYKSHHTIHLHDIYIVTGGLYFSTHLHPFAPAMQSTTNLFVFFNQSVCCCFAMPPPICFLVVLPHTTVCGTDRSHAPCIGRQSLSHWTTEEVP